MTDEQQRDWSHCMVTFHAGASYTVGGMRFNRNIPKRVTSLAIRKKLEGVKGFLLRDEYKQAAKAAPAVKTVKKKKTVKKVKKEGDE